MRNPVKHMTQPASANDARMDPGIIGGTMDIIECEQLGCKKIHGVEERTFRGKKAGFLCNEHKPMEEMEFRKIYLRVLRNMGRRRDHTVDHAFRGNGNASRRRRGLSVSDHRERHCDCPWSPCGHEHLYIAEDYRISYHLENRGKRKGERNYE
jgi:hypothetical protein